MASNPKAKSSGDLDPESGRSGIAMANLASSVQLKSDTGSSDALRRVDSVSSLYPPPQSAPSTIKSFKSTANLLSSQSASDIRRMINRSATFHEDVPFVRAMQNAREQRLTDQKAYLRHSWNRVDFLAIVSFWIMFILALTGVEAKESVYIFRALSTLRAARLLTVTAGTTVRISSCWCLPRLMTHR
jgi:hypothetical protein